MNYIKSLGLMGLCGVLMSCASISAIEKNYQTMVQISDGVDAQEAKIIAQYQLAGMYEKQAYRITAPDIRTSDYAKQYPQFWFITFGHNWFSPMSTDSAAKTYTELREGIYLVVIEKANGNVIFSGEWYPKRDASFAWVFHREDYTSKQTLELPPFSDGHPIGTGFDR